MIEAVVQQSQALSPPRRPGPSFPQPPGLVRKKCPQAASPRPALSEQATRMDVETVQADQSLPPESAKLAGARQQQQAALHTVEASTPTSVLGRPGSSGSSSCSLAAEAAPAAGEEAWKAHRKQWTSYRGNGTCKRRQQKHVLPPYAEYDDVIGPDGSLEQPVPLAEMVEILVEAWIDDGMYG